MKILLVDDEPEILKVLQLVLRSRDYTVETARNAADGLRLLETDSEFALVLTDYLMPGMDGCGFLLAIREQWADLPVMLMTACGMKEALMRTVNCPCSGFIEKPFGMDELFGEIERVLPGAQRPGRTAQES